VYKWVPVNLMLGVTLQWTNIIYLELLENKETFAAFFHNNIILVYE